MTTTFPQLHQPAAWMLAAVLIGQPAVLCADGATDRLIDLPHQRRLLVSTSPFAFGDVLSGLAVSAVGGGVVPRSLMLHAFTAELIDSAGQTVSLAGIHWGATLSMTRQGVGVPIALVQLGTESARVVLPKLLAYRIDARDSLELRVVMLDPPGDNGGIRVRVSIEYEALDGPVSRWAVVPAGLEMSDVSGTTRSWEWTADDSGRVLALAGLPLHGATELVLRDAATGAVLWRMSVPPADAAAFARPGNFVRLGLDAAEGQTFRLTVSYDREVGKSTAAATGVQVMLLPRRLSSLSSRESGPGDGDVSGAGGPYRSTEVHVPTRG